MAGRIEDYAIIGDMQTAGLVGTDPRHGRLVGNTPQAFSHFALIQTALNIEDHAAHHRRSIHASPAMIRKG